VSVELQDRLEVKTGESLPDGKTKTENKPVPTWPLPVV